MLLPSTMNLTCSLLCLDPPLPSTDIDVDMFDYDYDCSTPPSYVSSDDDDDSDDEDELNVRVAPHWQAYRHLFESHGYHLDTCKDVRQFYLRYWETRNVQQSIQSCAGYNSACREDRDENELCKDEGLVSPLLHSSHYRRVRASSGQWPRSVVHSSHRAYGSGELTTIPFPVHIPHPSLLSIARASVPG